ncbi:MAG: methyl-accepting chemotaxis protein [Burkholderiaceae bacterium]
MFKDLLIATRLAIGIGSVLMLTVLAIAAGLFEVAAVAEQNRQLLDEPLTKERITSDWYRVIDSGSKRTLAMAVSADPVLPATFADDMKSSTALSTKYQDELTRLATSAEEHQRMADIMAARKVYLNLRNEIATLRREGQGDAANAAAERLKPATTGYLGSLQAMLDTERSAIDRRAGAIRAEVVRSLWILGSLGVLVVALGAGFGFFIARGITRPIRDVIAAAHRVASGDVAHDIVVDRRDELGQLQGSMAGMSGQLRRMISEIHDSADVIAGASGEIAQGNTDLSQRTEEQAASLQRTAGSVEELSAAVRHNADSSAQAIELVNAATRSADDGDRVVGEVVRTMHRITDSSARINDIVGVIDGIAFQTNILALNAAVEAARAGEQGRGFAVVASEVRTLAQRSAAAAREVRALIESSSSTVDEGAKLVTHAGASMRQILQAVRKVEGIIGDISVAGRQQAAGLEDVNQAVAAIDATTQRNAALVEESAAAAMSLREQSRRLLEAVSAFNA